MGWLTGLMARTGRILTTEGREEWHAAGDRDTPCIDIRGKNESPRIAALSNVVGNIYTRAKRAIGSQNIRKRSVCPRFFCPRFSQFAMKNHFVA
jgi:hypothetical protein